MFQMIEEFETEKEKKGLRRIFREYEEWLRKQDWYDRDMER